MEEIPNSDVLLILAAVANSAPPILAADATVIPPPPPMPPSPSDADSEPRAVTVVPARVIGFRRHEQACRYNRRDSESLQ